MSSPLPLLSLLLLKNKTNIPQRFLHRVLRSRHHIINCEVLKTGKAQNSLQTRAASSSNLCHSRLRSRSKLNSPFHFCGCWTYQYHQSTHETTLKHLLGVSTFSPKPNVRFYSSGNKDTSVTDSHDHIRNGETTTNKTEVEDEKAIQNDPWVKSLLSDIRNDFQEDNKNDSFHYDENKIVPDNVVTDSNSKVKDDKSALDSYEYDYKYADDFEEYGYYDEKDIIADKTPEKILPISLERGETGVFELGELITLMEHLGADNIIHFPVPPEANYCDHMVIVTAKSKRHLRALNSEMLWVHKRKKSKKDPTLHIEGLDKSEWCAMDLGNLVLHIFQNEDTRQYYDIESLWILGPDEDPKSQQQQEGERHSYVLSAEDLYWMEVNKSTDKNKPEPQTEGKI